MFHSLATFHLWGNLLFHPLLIQLCLKQRCLLLLWVPICIEIEFKMWYFCLSFFYEQYQLKLNVSSSGLQSENYRLKRTMQMFFINFSYFPAIRLPLISSTEYKGHIYNATILKWRVLKFTGFITEYSRCASTLWSFITHLWSFTLLWISSNPAEAQEAACTYNSIAKNKSDSVKSVSNKLCSEENVNTVTQWDRLVKLINLVMLYNLSLSWTMGQFLVSVALG